MPKGRRLGAPGQGKVKSHLEETLATQLRIAKVRGWKREVTYIPDRKFRADFLWPKVRLCVEVMGGIYMSRGGHTTGQGYKRDCEKLCLTTLNGYRSLWVTGQHVMSGQALRWIQEALREQPEVGHVEN